MMRKKGRWSAAIGLAVALSVITPSMTFGSYAAISGLVPNTASWAYYTTQRYGTTVTMNVSAYPTNGDHLYAYLRRCSDDNPIGNYTPSSPATYTKPSSSYKTLASFGASTCFRITARKDWTWPWGSEWWNGNLYY